MTSRTATRLLVADLGECRIVTEANHRRQGANIGLGVAERRDQSQLRRYRLRLDVVGQSMRGYIDGKLVLEAQDPDLSLDDAGGGTALVLYKAAAQYDNWQHVRP